MASTVLIASRDSAVRDIGRRFLETCGYDVEAVTDALECVGKLMGGKYVALVLDRGLLWGGSDGLVARMRDERDFLTVPVILVARESDTPEELEQLIKDPVVAYLQKPLRMKAMLQWVREAERRSLDAIAK
jgi:DNA-binding response OmpR family regulator